MVVEIRVRGELGCEWEAWFEGLRVTVDGGESVLRGEVADQAALWGALRRVRDCGLVLVGVWVVEG